MTSTLRHRPYATRSNTHAENSQDNVADVTGETSMPEIIDLTNDDDDSGEDSSSPDRHKIAHEFIDFQIVKSEPLNKDELISLVITMSCIPYMLLISYTIFPTITLLCVAPWFLIVYVAKTYHTYQLPLKWNTFKSMASIMYRRAKDYMLTAYRNI